MYTIQTFKTKEIGKAGESFIGDLLTSRGYSLYKTNLTFWGSEIDLVVYRYDQMSNSIEIRLVEVKTRLTKTETYKGSNLGDLKLEDKVRKYKSLCADVGTSILKDLDIQSKIRVKSCIDLAIVGYSRSEKGTLDMYLKKYIQNVNLLI